MIGLAGQIVRWTQGSSIAVGSVYPSILTELQFQSINGVGWVLADGRNVSGTRYHAITGLTTIPDLRGMFLRAKNNGRSDGNQNPDGDVAIGLYQADDNLSHDHSVATSSSHQHRTLLYADETDSGTDAEIMDNDATGPSSSAYWPTQTSSASYDGRHGHTLQDNGSSEMRMKNVTMNLFVKING